MIKLTASYKSLLVVTFAQLGMQNAQAQTAEDILNKADNAV